MSSDQSSDRLFWRGVPVRSRRLAEWYDLSSWMRRQLRFLMRWPSSTMMYFQRKCCRYVRSFITISYEVTTTGNVSEMPVRPSTRRLARSLARSSIEPWYRMTGIVGANLVCGTEVREGRGGEIVGLGAGGKSGGRECGRAVRTDETR